MSLGRILPLKGDRLQGDPPLIRGETFIQIRRVAVGGPPVQQYPEMQLPIINISSPAVNRKVLEGGIILLNTALTCFASRKKMMKRGMVKKRAQNTRFCVKILS
jgi:hypothetical protein